MALTRSASVQPDAYFLKVEATTDLASQWFPGSATFDRAVSIDALVGQPVTDIDVVLPERATIVGTVVNEAGAPLSNYPISLYSPDENFASVGSTTTNVLGRFSIRPSTLADVVLRSGPGDFYVEEYYEDVEDRGRRDTPRTCSRDDP